MRPAYAVLPDAAKLSGSRAASSQSPHCSPEPPVGKATPPQAGGQAIYGLPSPSPAPSQVHPGHPWTSLQPPAAALTLPLSQRRTRRLRAHDWPQVTARNRQSCASNPAVYPLRMKRRGEGEGPTSARARCLEDMTSALRPRRGWVTSHTTTLKHAHAQTGTHTCVCAHAHRAHAGTC